MGRRLRSMLDDELDDLDRSLDSQVEDLGSISPMAHALDDATAPASVQQTTAERQLAEYQASRQARDLPVFTPAQQNAGKKGGQR